MTKQPHKPLCSLYNSGSANEISQAQLKGTSFMSKYLTYTSLRIRDLGATCADEFDFCTYVSDVLHSLRKCDYCSNIAIPHGLTRKL
ncbi:hypothetical protein ANCCAN_18512 [Ancylostoma caninum]|uniref:Uncharacterized protein n=1 Tax=Ancylostoma caninum TaxID=29170 RepID=A0A368FU54_ANCCA|nr:hypothetical protein ANCCAN_18512 [Ancylostoma caninum]